MSNSTRQDSARQDGTRKDSTWKVETAVPMLMTAGFFIHLVNASRHLLKGGSDVADILTWPVDLCLTALMLFCAIALIARRRAISATYDLTSLPRRIGYWVITVYITASLPGHFVFLATGNTSYFDVFPWWFSLVIMPVYIVMTAYFITLDISRDISRNLSLDPMTPKPDHARAEGRTEPAV